MKTILVFLLSFIVLPIYGQDNFVDLTGTVINQANTAVENIIVGLVAADVYDTTDELGVFELSSAAVSTITGQNKKQSVPEIRFERGEFVIHQYRGTERIRLDIYSLRGEKTHTLVDRTFSPGEHRVSADFLYGSRSASAVYIADLHAGSETIRYKLIKTGNGRISISGIGGISHSSRMDLSKNTQGDVSDTLVLLRRNALEFKTVINELTGNITVQLDLVPYEITEIANAEQYHYPDEVGQSLEYYPYDLAGYLQQVEPYGEHDYEAWCSEFLSWAYKAAGYPLTGGWNQDWMLRGNTQIRSWFQDNSRFVTKNDSDWVDFEPAPGDFIRYDNEYGGHTGIVRYQEGTTLYTVEGNVGNQVWLRTLTDWKDRSDVDGIGMRSGFAQSQVTTVVF